MAPRPRPTSTVIGLLSLVLASSLLVACGGSSGDGSSGEGSPADAASGPTASAFVPVTIDHSYGETKVEAAPRRIVSLDGQWTDVLVALDHAPVGYLADYNTGDGSFPWRGDGLAAATSIEATSALPYEKIAALQPDLIVVASYFLREQGDYDKLAAIAPTIASLSDKQVDTWQDITTAAGKVLGEQEAATRLVADVDEATAAVATDLPGLDGQSFAFANYVKGDMFYVLADPADGAAVLFDQLGLEISPAILDAGAGASGRAEISLERADLLDADVLLLLTNGADPSEVPGYDDLAAVRAGAVVDMDYELAAALNTPTPLSIPYALTQIRPALEAAAG